MVGSLLLPFPIDWYTQINKEYFTDDVQTVAAENLMPENQIRDDDDDDLGNWILEDPDFIQQQRFIMNQMGEEVAVDLESDEDEEEPLL